ncbi:MAG TPA: pantoate--beta-alanine ligase, partial [Sphingobium sp.]
AEDGLALSSRNAYLSAEERVAALALPRALKAAAAQICAGADVAEILAETIATIKAAGFSSVDYVALCDSVTLEPLKLLDRPARLLAAARIGLSRSDGFTTRLIDNISVNREEAQ